MKNLFFIFTFIISITIFTNAKAGTEIQNGGAGIVINGEVATFYSTSVQIYPAINNSRDLINLQPLLYEINLLTIPAKYRLELINNLTPSEVRRYFVVRPETLQPEVLQKIKNEYAAITKVSVENVTVFAITDPESKITLILPDFLKLKREEQMTILLHESLWIGNRVKDYQSMMNIDMAAQAYFEYRDSCSARYKFVSQLETVFNAKSIALNAVLDCEFYKYYSNFSVPFIPFGDVFDSKTIVELSEFAFAQFQGRSYDQNNVLAALKTDSSLSVFEGTRKAMIKEMESGAKLDIAYNPKFIQSPYGLESKEPLENTLFAFGQGEFFVSKNNKESSSFSIDINSIATIKLLKR